MEFQRNCNRAVSGHSTGLAANTLLVMQPIKVILTSCSYVSILPTFPTQLCYWWRQERIRNNKREGEHINMNWAEFLNCTKNRTSRCLKLHRWKFKCENPFCCLLYTCYFTLDLQNTFVCVSFAFWCWHMTGCIISSTVQKFCPVY